MLLPQRPSLAMPGQPRLFAFESAGPDQLLGVAFDAIQPRNVSKRSMGDLRLHRASVIELPSHMGPTEHLLDVAGGVDPVIAGERIGMEVACERRQELSRAIASTTRRIDVNRVRIPPVAAIDPESGRSRLGQTGIEHGNRRIVRVDRLR